MFGFVFVNTQPSPTDQLQQTLCFHWDPTDHISSCVAFYFFYDSPAPPSHTHTDRDKPGHGGNGRLVIAFTSPHVKVSSLASRQCLAETMSPPYRAPQERLCHYPQIVEDEMKRMSKSEAQGL